MRLKRYNRDTCLARKQSVCSIRISEKGTIFISQTLYAQLNPYGKEFIYVEFLQDLGSPEDWFIIHSNENEGFKVRSKSGAKGNCFYSSFLCKTLIDQIKPPASTDTRFTLQVKEDPLEFDKIEKAWLIITKPMEK